MLGAAGEHYVMSRLLRQGHIAALAPEGAPGMDILVSDPAGQSLCAVQVKAARNVGKGGWQMDQKHETFDSDRLFYVFLNFTGSDAEMPECWIVPSVVVAVHVRTTHQAWLKQGVEEGLSRKDSPKRSFHVECTRPPLELYRAGWLTEYREAWELLRLS